MVGQQEPVVTGDAVILDIQIAQLPVRALSALIDIIVVFVCYIIGVVLWAATLSQFDSAFSAAVLIVFTVLALVGYPVIFETATRGKTLGKMALGLRVVSDDGGPERFRQALFRALAAVVEIWAMTGGPAVICSLLNSKGKRIGDIFAGTVVITERAPKLSAPPLMPPPLAPVGGHAAALRPRPRAGRVGPPIPLSRIAIAPPGARPDGLPDHQRRRRSDLTTATAGHPSGCGARGRPRGTTSPGTEPPAAGAADRPAAPLGGPAAQWAVPPPQWPPAAPPTDHRPYPVAPTQAPSAPRSDGFTPPS